MLLQAQLGLPTLSYDADGGGKTWHATLKPKATAQASPEWVIEVVEGPNQVGMVCSVDAVVADKSILNQVTVTSLPLFNMCQFF